MFPTYQGTNSNGPFSFGFNCTPEELKCVLGTVDGDITLTSDDFSVQWSINQQRAPGGMVTLKDAVPFGCFLTIGYGDNVKTPEHLKPTGKIEPISPGTPDPEEPSEDERFASFEMIGDGRASWDNTPGHHEIILTVDKAFKAGHSRYAKEAYWSKYTDKATNAENAENAKEAEHAKNADDAINAINAKYAEQATKAFYADKAQDAENAVNAQKATSAERANFAERSKNADTSDHAKVADQANKDDLGRTISTTYLTYEQASSYFLDDSDLQNLHSQINADLDKKADKSELLRTASVFGKVSGTGSVEGTDLKIYIDSVSGINWDGEITDPNDWFIWVDDVDKITDPTRGYNVLNPDAITFPISTTQFYWSTGIPQVFSEADILCIYNDDPILNEEQKEAWSLTFSEDLDKSKIWSIHYTGSEQALPTNKVYRVQWNYELGQWETLLSPLDDQSIQKLDNAVSTATQALTTSNSSKQTADTAIEVATEANELAEDAKNIADEAKEKAETALGATQSIQNLTQWVDDISTVTIDPKFAYLTLA